MQMPKNFPIGLKNARLMIGDGALLTEGFDVLLRFFQFISGNRWEQVMLNLVIQSTVPEVSEGVSLDIARAKYLLM